MQIAKKLWRDRKEKERVDSAIAIGGPGAGGGSSARGGH